MISVGAIDCAAEENMPTCREYEVMGYPTLKFFTPNTPTGDMGIERHSREKTVPAIKKDMICSSKTQTRLVLVGQILSLQKLRG